MTYQPDLPTVAERVRQLRTDVNGKLSTERFTEFEKANETRHKQHEGDIAAIEARQEDDRKWRRQVILAVSVAAGSAFVTMLVTLLSWVANRG